MAGGKFPCFIFPSRKGGEVSSYTHHLRLLSPFIIMNSLKPYKAVKLLRKKLCSSCKSWKVIVSLKQSIGVISQPKCSYCRQYGVKQAKSFYAHLNSSGRSVKRPIPKAI